MEQNRFFLWTGRVNSVLFLLLLILSIGLVAVEIFRNTEWNSRNTVEIVDGSNNKSDEDLHIGEISKVGQNIEYVKLYSSSPSKGFSSGSYGSNTIVRNIIFFTGQEMKAHWLFDTNKYLVSKVIQLKTKTDDCKDSETVKIYYEVRKDDTNSNGKLDNDDFITVLLTSPNGLNYTEIESNITSVLDYSIDDRASILTLLVQSGEKLLMKKYSLISNKKISQKIITRIGKKM